MKKRKTYTRTRVLRVLLGGELERTRSTDVANHLAMSNSTLRRHLHAEGTSYQDLLQVLHAEGTSYQDLLNAVRQHACEKALSRRWVPGKCLAAELGFSEPNSFFRAFNRWTGKSYTQYKKEHCNGSASP